MSHLRLSPPFNTHPSDKRLASSLPSLRTATILLLPCLSMAGLALTWYLSLKNGLLDQLNAIFAQHPFPYFPGTNEPLILEYTGIRLIDNYLALLVAFFAPAVGEEFSDLGGFGRAGLGGFGAAWTLMVMESLRVGNQGKLISYVTVFGFFIQTITLTCTLPIYLLLHLLTSPISHANPSAYAAGPLFISPIDLHILPATIVLSYLVPSALMSRPFQNQDTLEGTASTFITPVMHQYFIALWQFFPLLTLIIHYGLRKAHVLIDWRLNGQVPAGEVKHKNEKSSSKTATTTKSATPSGSDYLRAVRPVYKALLALLVLTNFGVVLSTILPAQICTILWIKPSEASFMETFVPENPFSVFLPSDPAKFAGKIKQQSFVSFPKHVQTFLQYDIYVATVSLIVWSYYLHYTSRSEKSSLDPNSLPSYSPSFNSASWINPDNPFVHNSNPIYRDLLAGSNSGIGGTVKAYGQGRWIKKAVMIGRWAGWAFVGGPMAVVVLMIWERDEIVRRKVKQGN